MNSDNVYNLDDYDLESNYVEESSKSDPLEKDLRSIYHIDAYPSDDEPEQDCEGFVAAKIYLTRHNDIVPVITQPEYRLDRRLMKMVQEVIAEIRNENPQKEDGV